MQRGHDLGFVLDEMASGNRWRRSDINWGVADPSEDSRAIGASLDNPGAFGTIATSYVRTISRYVAHRVGHELAEDLTAEVFLTAFRARRAYRHEQSSALPWLYGVAANVVRNHQRSEQRRLHALGRMAAERRFTASAEESVDEALAAASEIQRVAAALGELPADWRETVVLVAVEGLSYEEAALAAGVPVGTIRSRLSRARQQLRRVLADARADPHSASEGRQMQ